MISGSGRTAAGARVRSRLEPGFWLAQLGAEVRVGSPELVRLALITGSMGLQMLVLFSPGHFRPAPNGVLAAWISLGTLFSLIACLAASLPVTRLLPRRLSNSLAAGSLLLLAVLASVGIWEAAMGVRAMTHGTPYGTDAAVMDTYAAQQVRHGHNPYLKTNIASALAAINAPATTTTPLMQGQFQGARAYPSVESVTQAFNNDLRYRSSKGVPIPPEFESKYNYPAGSILFILPFIWAGMHDMRFLYALACLGMGVYVWMRAPRVLKPLVPLMVLADVPLVILTTSGQPDPLYGLFLLIAYAEWPSRWISPLAMGIAIGTKQLAWFFIPLYLALILFRRGGREAVRRSALMLLVFLALNGPFIALSPAGYFSSIAAPMSDPMFPLGIGVIALFLGNVVPMLPKAAFAVAELVAWAGSTFASVRVRSLAPAAAGALGFFPLFFAWRSLINYFYLAPLLTLAIVYADNYRRIKGGARET